MHINEDDRKRRRTPKVRTGCKQCKQSHLKCCETKPVCQRCQRIGQICQYDAVKTWVFNSEPKPASSKALTALARPSQTLEWQSLSPEDKHALNHYFRHTAPWIAGHGPRALRKTWEVTIPRCAQTLPATRHVLIAVALIDEPIPSPDTSSVLARSHRVMHHYNLAIHALTRPGAAFSPLDTTLTSVLSWLLETLGFNSPLAKMHISGALGLAKQHLDPRLRKLAPAQKGDESEGVMSIDIPALLAFCQSYITLTPAAGNRHTPDELKTEFATNPVLEALLLRRGACPIKRPEEFRDAWILYFTQLQPLMPNGMSIPEAEEYIGYWKIAVVRYRYIMTVPSCIVLLGYTMAALARCMLPPNDNELAPNWEVNKGSIDFILKRAAGMLDMEMAPEHKMMQEELLSLMTTTIMRYSPNVSHQQLATAILEGCSHRPDYYAMNEHSPWQESSGMDTPLGFDGWSSGWS